MPSRHKRHKLLLDESLHLPNSYPHLNKLHDVIHIKLLDRREHEGDADQAVYKVAEKESRILILFNKKDFKRLVSPEGPSIICLSTTLTDEQVDKKLCSFLRKITPGQVKGKIFSVTQQGERRL